MATKIAENLWQLDIPLIGNPLKNLNSYLLLGGERNLLVDTGFRADYCREAMDAQLKELKVDMDRTDIFLTHQHSDHCGLAVDLIRPGCEILVGEEDGRALTENRTEAAWRKQFDMFIRNGFSQAEMDEEWTSNPAKNLCAPYYEGYHFVENGQVLSYGEWQLQTVLTPGHTPGHMCLYDAAHQLLISGDHILFHITPNITRWMGKPGTDALGAYLNSLDAVGKLPVRTLLPAHRLVTGDLTARIAELKAHHSQRLRNTYAIVQELPGANAYEIAAKMSWSIRCRSWEDFPLNQKYFAVGEAMAHLDYLRARGLVDVDDQNGRDVYYLKARGGEALL